MVESALGNRSRIVIFGVATIILLSGCGESKDLQLDVTQPSPIQDCTPGYKPCLPPMSDYDCKGGQGDGPGYTGRVEVTGTDPYDLDRDRDGFGC
jgi:hypothetical protein